MVIRPGDRQPSPHLRPHADRPCLCHRRIRPASVSQAPIGGSACGYQELFAALAIPTTTGQAGGEPYIYTLLHLVRTPAFAADRVERHEHGTFWSAKASDYLRGYFHAAALARYDLGAVAAWASGADPDVPERGSVQDPESRR